MYECKPLGGGGDNDTAVAGAAAALQRKRGLLTRLTPSGRGLHSSTFQLNLSRVCHFQD